MQKARIHHSLVVFVSLVFAGALAFGCSCADDEFNGAEACNKLVDAANAVLSSCGEPAKDSFDVCGHSTDTCSSGLVGCTPKTDVEGCVAAIKALSCGEVQARDYAILTACADVLTNISSSCSTSSDDDDFDD